MEEIKQTKVLRTTLTALHRGYKLIVQQGSTYSGKTFGIEVAIALFSASVNDPLKDWLVLGQTANELKTGAYKDWNKIMDILPIGRMMNKTEKEWEVGKSKILFKSIDKPGKATSGKRFGLYINEADNFSWEIVELLIAKSEVTIIDYNPTKKFWFHKKLLPNVKNLYNENEFLFVKSVYKDNPSLSEDQIRRIENMWLNDPFKYKVYVLGEMAARDGLVIPEYKTFREYPTFGKSKQYFLDFGFTNDVTALGEAMIAGDSIYSKQLIYKTGLLTKDLNDLMVKLKINKNTPIHCDNIPKEVAELAMYGWILIKTKKFNGSVLSGINILKQYKHFVHELSMDAQEEFDNYEWVKTQDGEYIDEPIDKYNHYIDGLRYYAMVNASQSVIQSSQPYGASRLV